MPKFQTVVEVLQHWGTTDKDRQAFIFRAANEFRSVMTCGQLYTLGGHLAHLLHEDGVARGQILVNTLPNSPERAVCEAGILMCGAASVNGICHLADGSDLMNVMTKSQASAIFLDPDLLWGPWTFLQHHVNVKDGKHVTSDTLPFLRRVYFVRRRRTSTTNKVQTTQGDFSNGRESAACGKEDGLSQGKKMKEHFSGQNGSNDQDSDRKEEKGCSSEMDKGADSFRQQTSETTDKQGTVCKDKLNHLRLKDKEKEDNNKSVVNGSPTNVTKETVFSHQPRQAHAEAEILDLDSEDFLSSLEKVNGFYVAKVIGEDIATIFTSSGSTGFSKLVTYTHKTVVGVGTIITKEEDYETCDKLFSIASMGWPGGYAFNFLCSGNCRVLLDVRADLPIRMDADPAVSLNSRKSEVETGTDLQSESARSMDISKPETSKSIGVKCETTRSTDVHESVRAKPALTHGHQRLSERDRAALIWDTIVKEKCLLAALHPPLVLQILRLKDRAPWKLNMLFLMGQLIYQRVVSQCGEITCMAFVSYGCTELSLVTAHPVTDFESFQDLHAGKPLPGCQVKICDQSGKEVPAGTRGEIYAKASSMFSGYYNQPEETAASMTQDGFLKTQDIGIMLEDGSLIVEGRAQDAIFKRQFIIYPGWLEARIQRCPGVHEIVIVNLPDKDGLAAYLCACFVPSDPEVTEEDVRKFVEKDIATSEDNPESPKPHYYLKFLSFPTTYTGKPRRKDIRKEAIRRIFDGAEISKT